MNVIRSDNGEIDGKWGSLNMLLSEDGGHGMIFRSFDEKLKLFSMVLTAPQVVKEPNLWIYEIEGSMKVYNYD